MFDKAEKDAVKKKCDMVVLKEEYGMEEGENLYSQS